MAACKKTPTPNFHKEYFGMRSGAYVIYDAVEITHDKDLELHDTSYYQLKTVWGDLYVDDTGRDALEFKRYKRQSEGEQWVLTDTWYGLIDGPRAELVEENQRIVKLYFAPTLNKIWNGNAYNSGDEENKYYRAIHQDTMIGSISLDSTLVVESDLWSSSLDSLRSHEVYAKDIGLVYKHWKDNHYQFKNNPQPGEDPVDPEVDKGTELYLTYVSSGTQ